jgi:hypothetical protein
MRWISTARLVTDAVKLASKLPKGIAGIVGIPRSGMIPAATMATILHVPLLELTDCTCWNSRTASSRGHLLRERHGPLVVVDDTVYSGAAITRARAIMRGKQAIFSAVYVHPAKEKTVDVFGELLPPPHFLEWNFPNHGPYWGAYSAELAGIYRKGVASDIDGVCVHDEDSGGELGKPYLAPRVCECPLLITGRAEKWRKLTEDQLNDHGIRWTRLEMLPNGMNPTWQNCALHKALVFRESECGLFIESCPLQAELINHLSKRPVICPRTEKVYQG